MGLTNESGGARWSETSGLLGAHLSYIPDTPCMPYLIIFAYIGAVCGANVGIYAIHGVLGYCMILYVFVCEMAQMQSIRPALRREVSPALEQWRRLAAQGASLTLALAGGRTLGPLALSMLRVGWCDTQQRSMNSELQDKMQIALPFVPFGLLSQSFWGAIQTNLNPQLRPKHVEQHQLRSTEIGRATAPRNLSPQQAAATVGNNSPALGALGVSVSWP